jgi:hypothetical protein
VQRPLDEAVADGRNRQVNFAGKDVWQDEPAILASLDGRPALDGHEHLGKRHARPGVDNDRLDRRAVGRADRILRRGIPGQRSRTDDQFRNRLDDSVGSASRDFGILLGFASECVRSVRYTGCSRGWCRRPEYLRQGAVSCWGAGSLANTKGIA